MTPKQLLFIIGLWLVIIGGLIVSKEWIYQTGRTVTIEVQPVDPTDLFRGSYVNLSYDISRLPPSLAEPLTIDDIFPGQTVYVTVTEENNTLVPQKILLKRPLTGELFIKGIVIEAEEKDVRIEYGIESYFASEDKAKELEAYGRTGRLESVVVIDESGEAVLQDLKMK